jgi:hypothetical protein
MQFRRCPPSIASQYMDTPSTSQRQGGARRCLLDHPDHKSAPFTLGLLCVLTDRSTESLKEGTLQVSASTCKPPPRDRLLTDTFAAMEHGVTAKNLPALRRPRARNSITHPVGQIISTTRVDNSCTFHATILKVTEQKATIPNNERVQSRVVDLAASFRQASEKQIRAERPEK